MPRFLPLVLAALMIACSDDGASGPTGPQGSAGPVGPPGAAGEFAWIQFDVADTSYGEHYGSRPFYKVVMLHDRRITPRTFVNVYVQASRNSVNEYIPVDLWLRAQEKFDPAAYGPIYFLQETGLWIVDANEFLMHERLWVSVVTPAE
jgi:hypothetical protein